MLSFAHVDSFYDRSHILHDVCLDIPDGKVTAILGPVLFGALLGYTRGIIIPLSAIAVVMAVGGLLLAALGPETKGQIFT